MEVPQSRGLAAYGSQEPSGVAPDVRRDGPNPSGVDSTVGTLWRRE